MKYAFVNTNVLDLRAKPSHSAERVNQTVFGQLLTLTQSRGDFGRVRLADGYYGWVDQRLIAIITRTAYHKFSRLKAGRIVKKCRLFQQPGSGQVPPHQLLFGTPVWLVGRSKQFVRISLPDGAQYYLSSNSVVQPSRLSRLKPTSAQLVREAKKFLGVPYLWGGITPLGWDCSGMVQTILARFGISVPRDTKDQIKVGQLVAEDNIKSGDLLFFDRHVGFAIGADRLIHSSLSGGGVRINSWRPGGTDYRPDLAETFKQARRIL